MMKIDFEKLQLRSDQSYWLSDAPFTGTAIYRREPQNDVLRALDRYAERYGIEPVIDIEPF